jgi:5-methyltetrahydrofolate--homocysteine methyltransferase
MFIVIGERINTSRKAVMEAVETRDKAYIQDDAKKQQAAGATYIDVNAGACIGHEMEGMSWLIQVIQEAVNLPLCLDSPDPKVLEKAMSLVDKTPIVNSISLEKDRYAPMMEFLEGQTCGIVALCMDDTGMPTSAYQVIGRASRLIEGLAKIGFQQDRIYIDPLIQPLATDTANGPMALATVRGIAERHPQVHFACGLSNISYGLPQRKLLNRAFLTLLMANGLDGAIIDPLDTKIMTTIKTAEALLGKDDYCAEYLAAFRKNQLVI